MIKNRKNPGFFSAPSPEGASANRTPQKLVLVLFMTLFTAGAGFAFDAATFYKTFPKPIAQKSLLLSLGLDIGHFYSYWDNNVLVGGSVAVDYALPLDFLSLTVGGQIGIAGADLSKHGYTAGIGVLPILARAAWHPNWGIDKLDTYAMLKLGFGIGFWTGDHNDLDALSGFAYGFTLGCRWFFTDSIGIFGELGYDQYFLRSKLYDSAYGDKFLTIGVTFKFGGSQ